MGSVEEAGAVRGEGKEEVGGMWKKERERGEEGEIVAEGAVKVVKEDGGESEGRVTVIRRIRTFSILK